MEECRGPERKRAVEVRASFLSQAVSPPNWTHCAYDHSHWGAGILSQGGGALSSGLSSPREGSGWLGACRTPVEYRAWGLAVREPVPRGFPSPPPTPTPFPPVATPKW